MSPVDFPLDWTQVGVGVAAILGLIYVTRTFSRSTKDLLNFLALSMSNVSSSIEALAVSLASMSERIAALHEDNRRQTEALLRATEAEVASLKEFEARVKERHLALADKLPKRTGQALREAIKAEPAQKNGGTP